MRVMIINLKKREQVRIKVRNMYMDNIEEKRKKKLEHAQSDCKYKKKRKGKFNKFCIVCSDQSTVR